MKPRRRPTRRQRQRLAYKVAQLIALDDVAAGHKLDPRDRGRRD